MQDAQLTMLLYSSSFCGACARTRTVLDRAAALLGDRVRVEEHNVATEPELAASAAIEATPTVAFLAQDGSEVHRAVGVPSIDQVLTAVSRTLD